MNIPDEVLKLVIEHCVENELSVMEVGDSHVTCLIVGDRDYSPDQIAIIIAHMLLEGVITGSLRRQNAQAVSSDDISKVN